MHPGQAVTVQLLLKDGDGDTYQPHGEPLRLSVVRLLGTGGLNEVHEVQQLPAGGATADTVGAAGCVLGGSSVGRQRMALKLPLRHAVLPAGKRQGLCAMDDVFYAHGSKLLLAEHNILTTLGGQAWHHAQLWLRHSFLHLKRPCIPSAWTAARAV
jgi:hypothetical protein